MEKEVYTLISGASMGLGKELARECALRKMNLILVALPGEEIELFGTQLQRDYKIKVDCFEVNLTIDAQINHLIKVLNEEYNINILINNAGVGGSNAFNQASREYIDNIMLLNIRATVLLTHSLLDNLKQHSRAHILNIASMASFSPMPFKTVYPASKAFVYSFSRGLYSELKDSGVFVSVAHPGGMATNPQVSERIRRHNRLVRSTILSVEETAQICIRQLLKGDSLIIPGAMNKVSYLCLKILPTWLQLNFFRKSIVKEITTQKSFA
ncbi:MAG: SDR family NAD(P)-dependent oxidoreductase [Bacteroidales bacterium]